LSKRRWLVDSEASMSIPAPTKPPISIGYCSKFFVRIFQFPIKAGWGGSLLLLHVQPELLARTLTSVNAKPGHHDSYGFSVLAWTGRRWPLLVLTIVTIVIWFVRNHRQGF
jgi:hypothetical protein